MQIRKLVRRGNTVGLVVPSAYMAKLAWGPGDYVSLEIADGGLTVRNLAAMTGPAETAPKQKGVAIRGTRRG